MGKPRAMTGGSEEIKILISFLENLLKAYIAQNEDDSPALSRFTGLSCGFLLEQHENLKYHSKKGIFYYLMVNRVILDGYYEKDLYTDVK